ncbi:MAG: PolC-type DNA polymerase III [Eubacteriales bacterium]|nr:PolC-type DNA polymerase III [Eubacteriales bacterium]
MRRPFSAVFHTLKPKPRHVSIIEHLQVERIQSDANYSYLRVHVVADVLIPKAELNDLAAYMEAAFSRHIILEERYELPGDHGLAAVYAVYKEDIGESLRREGVLMQRLFSDAEFSFSEEDCCLIRIPERFAYTMRAPRLKEILEDLFQRRFGLTADIRFEFTPVSDDETGTHHTAPGLTADLMAYGRPAAASAEKAEKTAVSTVKTETAARVSEKKSADKGRRRAPASGLCYGSSVDGTKIRLVDADELSGIYVMDVMIFAVDDERKTRNGSHIVIFNMTDFTDSMAGKMFVAEDELPAVRAFLHKGSFLRIKGRIDYDGYEQEIMLTKVLGIKTIEPFDVQRTDQAPVKRIELSARTKMSKMQAVSDVKDLIETAKRWGHPALGIADIGVVHAFPDAMHAAGDFPVIYGMSANMVDDAVSIIQDAGDESFDHDVVVFDLETTGLHAGYDKIIEIGAVRISGGEIQPDGFQTFVNPHQPLPYHIIRLTDIHDKDLAGAPEPEEALRRFRTFCDGAVLAAHNASFDMSFIKKHGADCGIDFNLPVIDTLTMARRLLKTVRTYRLGTLAKHFKISLENAHRALDDARATAGVYLKLAEMARKEGVETMADLSGILRLRDEEINKMMPGDVSLLVQNEVGRVNLYTLVSASHLYHFEKVAKMPKSLIAKHRAGLLIGSGTADGAFQQALLAGNIRSPEELVSFYDYLEVQPPELYLADADSFDTKEKVERHIRTIVEMGEKYGLPVVATGDVRFLEPSDDIYRRIIRYGDKGAGRREKFAPAYFRTTDEMLASFSFLGERKAREIVVENTHKIFHRLENVSPIMAGTFPPEIENSDKTLREICFKRAVEIYGPELPEPVRHRLERELDSIIGNGFAVMYIIAEKLVKRSNDAGYLVGSRGSVGSSFVATMAGITEVNPLPPHYYCPACHYHEFDSELLREYQGLVGCDLPARDCPTCGGPLCREGFDIPFETFLGFKGNKEPDIDLNFSGEYQSRAHEETENIFGKGQTFRAGTISGVKEKTAFGYVRGYLEEMGIVKRKAEMLRLAKGVEGVKRTTGQHPGGIIVLPMGQDINRFTPVQRPADEPNSPIVTTHFDYHSIEHNLLKLDILGHDDPTMIRRLEQLTGLDAREIPLDEPKVMSIFHSPAALGVQPSEIMDCPVGCRGIPEFGTEFTIQMVVDTQPQTFSDLINISGLSHGTDVWVGNAKDLIAAGTATIRECICTRDAIMTFLIAKGMDNEQAFTIMESVRKGKGLRPEWEEMMRESGVSEWYIESCKKIKYMFPKAHAVAYVMMGYRIAYFKVYHPLAYYAAFFSIRAKTFNYGLMCRGKATVEANIATYEALTRPTASEKDTLRDLYMVQEFYARGFEFADINLYDVHATDFQIIDGRVMPSLSVIDGMGMAAATAVMAEAKRQKFLSKEDLKTRCRLSVTTIELMDKYGIISELKESNQASIFDYM